MDDLKMLNTAIAFTKTYKKYYNEHRAVREAMCLKELYPASLEDIREFDLYAGRLGPLLGEDVPADFSPQKFNHSGYVMN